MLGDELLILAHQLEPHVRPLVKKHGARAVADALVLLAGYLNAGKPMPVAKTKPGPKPALDPLERAFYAWLYVEAHVRGGRGKRTASQVCKELFRKRKFVVVHKVLGGTIQPVAVKSAGRLANLHSAFTSALEHMTPHKRRIYERWADAAGKAHRNTKARKAVFV